MDHLLAHNQSLVSKAEAFVERKKALQKDKLLPSNEHYPLMALQQSIEQSIGAKLAMNELQFQFELIDRKKMQADWVLKIPSLMKIGGPKQYIAKFAPIVLDILNTDYKAYFAKVEHKGIYINMTFADHWLKQGLVDILSLKSAYGHNTSMQDRSMVVDYSSPNVAKRLHSGHIRSTIIGQVIKNIYDANGALTYGLNYINDFGGFGFMLEGLRRFDACFTKDMSGNDKLLVIYQLRRVLEKISVLQDLDEASPNDLTLLTAYQIDITSVDSIKSYNIEFTQASDERFRLLEQGDKDEVELWQQAVSWSLADFDQFYQALNMNIDLVLGESFNFQAGNELVEQSISNGTAVVFDQNQLNQALSKIETLFADEKISSTEKEHAVEQANKDLGAVVVLLPANKQGIEQRMVIRKSDGLSIYATRDLGGIAQRKAIFDATDLIYEVGPEQRIHFERLFASAKALKLAEDESPLNMLHVYHGFYVDSKNGKKLSSRDSVSGVMDLLAASFEYFKSKYQNREDLHLSDAQINESAKQLSVGSLVFNDIKQDIKGSVEIETENFQATIESFEKSGGAYVVYAACRARSILNKYATIFGKGVESLNHEVILSQSDVADSDEVALVLKLFDYPKRLIKAGKDSNPTLIVRYLLELSQMYNTYYVKAKVIEGDTVNEYRLALTHAVMQVLVAGLKVCHIDCPEQI